MLYKLIAKMLSKIFTLARMGLFIVGITAICAPTSYARSPYQEALDFAYTWDVGPGNSVFVVGDHPDVGMWQPTNGMKLYWSSGNVWTGRIAVQSGTTLSFKYIARSLASDEYCDPANVTWIAGGNLTNRTSAQPDAPYSGKTILYHTSWTNAAILYKQVLNEVTNWLNAVMTPIGAGRAPGEYLYQVSGIAETGEALEFVPHGYLGGTEYWDNAPYPGYDNNYYTSLDVFFLQDGNIYNYWPPASVSGSQIIKTNVYSSWAPDVPSRDMWIYLPRGYAENTWKSYPVIYMQDGTNVFSPGGIYGSWDAGLTADKEISQGRMRETIICAVDQSPKRSTEYIPPGDNWGAGPGKGDLYADFLIHNVRPTVDTHHRTLNDPENTINIGSSFGGIISLYLGLETNVFGKVGPFSPAFWACPNFVGRIESNASKVIRVYMDMGTEEGTSYWNDMWGVADDLMRDSYAMNKDLMVRVGCGAVHNEGAWAARLPWAYQFLLNIWDEPNVLAQEIYPPEVTNIDLNGSVATCNFMALKGRSYVLERSANLAYGLWKGVYTSSVESLPWAERSVHDMQVPMGARQYYRVVTEPWP